MREIVTAARLREVLRYEPETGLFTWLRGHRTGATAGTVNVSGYVQIKVDGRLYYAHRLAWLYVYGIWPTNEVDHRNTRRSDNSLQNLRDASRTVNSENLQSAHSDGGSGLLGVSWSKEKSKWHARIRIKGRTKFLGYFESSESAGAAYVAAKRTFHEGNQL